MSDGVTLADAPEEVQDLAPSCKLVWLLLVREGPMTHAELVESTALASRTARWARDRLAEHDIIASTPSTRDARKEVYRVRDASDVKEARPE